MRLSQREIEKIAKLILKHLGLSGIRVSDEQKSALLIASIINENMEAEKELEDDAMKLLRQHRQSLGSSLDEEKALRMIKQKLADERKFVL